MLITLKPDADARDVTARLQALGLWTTTVTSGVSGDRGVRVEPGSRQIPAEAVLRDVPGVADIWISVSPHPKVDEQARGPVTVGGVSFGTGEPVLMSGPCSAESEELTHRAAALVARAGGRFLRGGAFKPRTSPYSFSGHGRPALRWLREAADAHGLLVVTEVMSEHNVDVVAEHADLLQIGSRNMQNFALLREAGAVGKPVLLKRGMSATVADWLMSGEHALAAGASAVIFCERGIRGFDPELRNLLDLASVALMKHVYRQPVIVDPSHGVGRRDLILPMARAAIAAGADGLLVEMHPDAATALSDGPQSLTPEELETLATTLDIPRRVEVG